MITIHRFSKNDLRTNDVREVQEAAWNYIKALKGAFEIAGHYDDIMGRGMGDNG